MGSGQKYSRYISNLVNHSIQFIEATYSILNLPFQSNQYNQKLAITFANKNLGIKENLKTKRFDRSRTRAK